MKPENFVLQTKMIFRRLILLSSEFEGYIISNIWLSGRFAYCFSRKLNFLFGIGRFRNHVVCAAVKIESHLRHVATWQEERTAEHVHAVFTEKVSSDFLFGFLRSDTWKWLLFWLSRGISAVPFPGERIFGAEIFDENTARFYVYICEFHHSLF